MRKSLSSILFEAPEGQPKERPLAVPGKASRIDLDFELLVLRCAIGCLINDLPMSDPDYVRMHLAIARLLKG